MDRSPNVNFAFGTNSNKVVSGHLIGSVRISSLSPRTVIFLTRVKAIDKKFKLNLGVHLPAVQINEDYFTDTFFAQEVRMSYPLAEKNDLNFMYLHGKGRNNDLEINLFVLDNYRQFEKLSLQSQIYFLDRDALYGAAQSFSYTLKEKIYLTGFINYTIPSKDLFGTVGLKFDL